MWAVLKPPKQLGVCCFQKAGCGLDQHHILVGPVSNSPCLLSALEDPTHHAANILGLCAVLDFTSRGP